MTLIGTLGALLKYELHQIGHRDASVLVSLTPQEWADLQQSALEAPPSTLKDVTAEAISTAHVVPQVNGTVAVQLKAGDYAKVSDAHVEATAPTVQAAEEPAKPEEKKPDDTKDSA